MPCNSDHLEPHAYEVEGSRMIRLLDELDLGTHVNARTFSNGSDPRVYNKALSKEVMDALTAYLCAKVKDLSINELHSASLELQMWWRDHQKVDAEKR